MCALLTALAESPVVRLRRFAWRVPNLAERETEQTCVALTRLCRAHAGTLREWSVSSVSPAIAANAVAVLGECAHLTAVRLELLSADHLDQLLLLAADTRLQSMRLEFDYNLPHASLYGVCGVIMRARVFSNLNCVC